MKRLTSAERFWCVHRSSEEAIAMAKKAAEEAGHDVHNTRVFVPAEA